MKPDIDFLEFPKISRYSREVIVTEKIDGSNASIHIPEPGVHPEGTLFTGSRTRWIEPGDDNFGFAAWAHKNKDELLKLGPGHHYGEWWGSGIQRGYGLTKGEKRFSLFNVSRWGPGGKDETLKPACCHVVPVLWRGNMDDLGPALNVILANLRDLGSVAAKGFSLPEGVVIYHVAGGVLFKKTLEKDDQPKGKVG